MPSVKVDFRIVRLPSLKMLKLKAQKKNVMARCVRKTRSSWIFISIRYEALTDWQKQ